jgi:hypothetical protein
MNTILDSSIEGNSGKSVLVRLTKWMPLTTRHKPLALIVKHFERTVTKTAGEAKLNPASDLTLKIFIP